MTDRKLLQVACGLLIAIFLHSLYLNYELIQVKSLAEEASDYASEAEDYARAAADYSEQAANNASEAASYASDAVYYANDASDNAFGNVCGFCP